ALQQTGRELSQIFRNPSGLVRLMLLEMAAQAMLLLETYFALITMGLTVSLLTASMTEIMTKVANVGFVGAAEGAYVFLFHALGLPSAAGLALSLVKRLRSLAYALLGLGILALFPNLTSGPETSIPVN